MIDGDFDKNDEQYTAQVLGIFTQSKNADNVTMIFLSI
ncbi:hypothetical protein [Francisella persica]|nr:hypothetical protein [Francisella persica]